MGGRIERERENKNKSNVGWLHLLGTPALPTGQEATYYQLLFSVDSPYQSLLPQHHQESAWGLEYQTIVEIKEKETRMLCCLSL